MNKKKLLALLMALVMTLTLVPVTALAEEDTPSEPVNVAKIGETPYTTLAAAFTAANTDDTISLVADVNDTTLGSKGIVVAGDKTITLDLAGHDITCTDGSGASDRMIKITGTTTLNVINSSTDVSTMSVCGENTNSIPYGVFRNEQGTTLNITATNNNIVLKNGRKNGLNVKVLGGVANLSGVVINSTTGGGIEVTEADLGNQSQKGKATLTNCTFTQSNYGDWCSTCLSVSGGSELVINSGSYSGDNYVLYVFSSGGVIKVNGGTFTDTNPGDMSAIKAEIDTNTYSAYTGGLTISGGNFTGGYEITSPAYMSITGGTFDHDPTAYLATGYEAVENPTGTWTVGVDPNTAVARIDETYFTTLDAAVDDAEPGDTVKLLDDITYDENHTVTAWGKAVNLDLNGHTLTTNSGVGKDLNNMGYTASAICFAADAGENTISNGKIVTAYGAGVYAAGHEVTLSNLDITAATTNVQSTKEYSSAVRLSSGAKVIIESGKYTANNGGYALAVSNSGGDVTVNGGTFTGDIFFSEGINKNLTRADKKITIHDGYFKGNFVNTDKGTLSIDGGYFTNDPTTYVDADNYTVESVEEVVGDVTYNYHVKAKPVAQIGETKYETLQGAFDAGGDVTLLKNVVLSAPAVVTKTVNLDMAAYKIYNEEDIWSEDNGNLSLISVQAGGNLTVTGNGTVIAKENDCFAFDVRDGGKLTIENGTFVGNIDAVYVINQSGSGVSELNVNGGAFSILQLANNVTNDKYRYTLNCYDDSYNNNSAKITVKGGTFENFDPSNCQAEGPNTNFVASGYTAVENTPVNGKWTVKPAVTVEDREVAVDVANSDSTPAVSTSLTGVNSAQVIAATKVNGVQLTTTNTVNQNTSGLQAVINAAKTKSAAASSAIEDASSIEVKVNVAVTLTDYNSTSSQETATFSLTPTATVTVTDGNNEITEVSGVAVTNDMIDQTQDITVTLYTGFQPVQLIHKDGNTILEYFNEGEFDYENGVVTLTIHHFSDLVASATKSSQSPYHYSNLTVDENGIPTAPTVAEDNTLFCGWYEDEGYSNPITSIDAPITNAYAKFIHPSTLTVGIQVRQETIGTVAGASDIRLITTVPDTQYFAKVGFKLTLPSHDNFVVSDHAFNTPLYDAIRANGSVVTLADFVYGADIDGGASAKLALQTVTGVPASYFSDNNTYRFKVVPYLITKDGRTVEGTARYFKGAINDNGRTFVTSDTLAGLN